MQPYNILHCAVFTALTLTHFAVAQLFILQRQNKPLPQMKLSCSAVILYGSDSFFFDSNVNFATAKWVTAKGATILQCCNVVQYLLLWHWHILLWQNESLLQVQLSCSAVILYCRNSFFFSATVHFATAKWVTAIDATIQHLALCSNNSFGIDSFCCGATVYFPTAKWVTAKAATTEQCCNFVRQLQLWQWLNLLSHNFTLHTAKGYTALNAITAQCLNIVKQF